MAPPSSPPSDAYLPSSGSQLVEFLPPALVPDAPFDGAGDTAEISVGPNERSPCFRFNFYGASLGCAAEGVEQWCEFEFSAYTYNETSGSEASLSWSETKRVPACPNFPQGPCPLTPVQLDGYNNLASILISVRVGLELRAWWADDLQIGWTDNTCEAASCRTNAIARRAKREVFSRASRRTRVRAMSKSTRSMKASPPRSVFRATSRSCRSEAASFSMALSWASAINASSVISNRRRSGRSTRISR